MQHLATVELPVARLRVYPGNARRSGLRAIADSLRANGQYRALVVRADDPTDPLAGGTILAGNHTFLAANGELGWSSMRCEVIDCDEVAARRIVLVDNRLADRAKYDNDALTALLEAAADDGGLDGTGWTEDELAKLAGVLPAAGDADVDELAEAYGVVVECDTEQQQTQLLAQLDDDGWRVRALMT